MEATSHKKHSGSSSPDPGNWCQARSGNWCRVSGARHDPGSATHDLERTVRKFRDSFLVPSGMARKPRHLLRPGCLVEVTVNTVHSHHLLRPSGELNRIFAGCLGRAHELHPVRLHAVVSLGTHFHLLLSPEDSQQMAGFMGHLNCNLSKKVGRIHDWSGSMFERRYTCIPVSDEPAAQEARLRYLLCHGCKEGLVHSPRDWPGIHSATALCDGTPIQGTWISRTEYWKARNRGEDVVPSQFGTDYEIHLEPLPCWEHLDEEVWRQNVREIVKDIERETRETHRREGTAPAGAIAVTQTQPHYQSVRKKRSPAPLFHAASKAIRLAMRDAFSSFLASYREAAERVRKGELGVTFPPDCFPPRLPYVTPG